MGASCQIEHTYIQVASNKGLTVNETLHNTTAKGLTKSEMYVQHTASGQM